MSTVETKATLEADNARLLSRISELEAELAKKDSSESKKHPESKKFREETMDDAMAEANKLMHAMAQAFVEEIRSTADVVKTVADEAFKRRQARMTKIMAEKGLPQFADIENDVLAVVNKGIEKSLAAPQRVMDKFHEVYHERASA